MDEFEGAGGGPNAGWMTAASFGGGEGEERTEAFAPVENRVAHGLVEEGRAGVGGGKGAVEFLFEADFPAFELPGVVGGNRGLSRSGNRGDEAGHGLRIFLWRLWLVRKRRKMQDAPA